MLKEKKLWFILVVFIALAWAYGLVMPPFENLDEVEHFAAIRYVADTGSLPVHDPALQEQYLYRQEASQPPLYYILMGGLTRLLGLSTDDANSYLLSNPFVACGPSDNPYNKHALYHNPSRDAFPWKGALLALHVLRALTPLLQLVTLVSVYAIARLILPQYPYVAPLAAALTAFNPQFLSVASGVNNDNLVTPLATLGLYLALLTRQRGLSPRRSLGLGFLAGLAGLSKLSGLLLLALIGLILLEMLYRSNTRSLISNILTHGLLIGGTTIIITSWWFWRNWQLYRDLTALEPMLKLVGRREAMFSPLFESELMFRSFWGQIACSFFNERFYLFFGLLTAVGLIGGLICWWREKDRSSRGGMLFLVLWFGIILAGWARWDALTPAPGGRLLFPAIAATSTLLAYGLLNLWPLAWRGRVALVAVVMLAAAALATLCWELRPFFALPRTYTSDRAPDISYPLEATFDTTIGLLGYDAEIQGQTPHLDVTLYWQALVPISQDYVLAIQLTSPLPGDDSLRFNYNTWPGRGNYPTTAWSPGRIIADHYHFRLPESDAPTQAWQLLVAFYEKESGERLPAHIGEQDVGRGLVLTTLRVPGRSPECPGEAAWDPVVHFGPAESPIVSLSGAVVGDLAQNQVSLCWNSLSPAALDYTVFVHLYDENGALIATADGPPLSGAFPTRLWQPGDKIVDTHVFADDVSPQTIGGYHIGVGLYDPASGERLQATQAGQSLLNNVVLFDAPP
jgi:4-amino-4-deoxy-L-arabinose transferase-like glycosyltransferase